MAISSAPKRQEEYEGIHTYRLKSLKNHALSQRIQFNITTTGRAKVVSDQQRYHVRIPRLVWYLTSPCVTFGEKPRLPSRKLQVTAP